MHADQKAGGWERQEFSRGGPVGSRYTEEVLLSLMKPDALEQGYVRIVRGWYNPDPDPDSAGWEMEEDWMKIPVGMVSAELYNEHGIYTGRRRQLTKLADSASLMHVDDGRYCKLFNSFCGSGQAFKWASFRTSKYYAQSTNLLRVPVITCEHAAKSSSSSLETSPSYPCGQPPPTCWTLFPSGSSSYPGHHSGFFPHTDFCL